MDQQASKQSCNSPIFYQCFLLKLYLFNQLNVSYYTQFIPWTWSLHYNPLETQNEPMGWEESLLLLNHLHFAHANKLYHACSCYKSSNITPCFDPMLTWVFPSVKCATYIRAKFSCVLYSPEATGARHNGLLLNKPARRLTSLKIVRFKVLSPLVKTIAKHGSITFMFSSRRRFGRVFVCVILSLVW